MILQGKLRALVGLGGGLPINDLQLNSALLGQLRMELRDFSQTLHEKGRGTITVHKEEQRGKEDVVLCFRKDC